MHVALERPPWGWGLLLAFPAIYFTFKLFHPCERAPVRASVERLLWCWMLILAEASLPCLLCSSSFVHASLRVCMLR